MLLKSNVKRYFLFAQQNANSQHFNAQSLSHGFAVPAPLTLREPPSEAVTLHHSTFCPENVTGLSSGVTITSISVRHWGEALCASNTNFLGFINS